MALINGRQYEFADLTLILGGRDVTGFRGIKYTEKQEKEVLYGKGNRPISIQKGNISYEGEITLTQSELETLKAFARTQSGRSSIMSLNLNAVVAYGNPLKGDPMITDVLYNIQFTEEAKELKQGDKFMEITLPFICTDISYQLPS
ncbi:MAG: hypothetical protein NC038_05525 [Paludibacter sp.]|nr:hypothetical protein [Bacteroidales bacterium]MCM1069831.1 hypothetical protein [Prevotella sp.]MCM1353975.1 hypothetical protein [Bacteroides sp.]MCM1443383.1 hypothetical protein [Muribaculum sp.]MCM1482086.1 hypothetical protein [Paludibacter sp.]